MHKLHGIKRATSGIPGRLSPPVLKGDLGGLLMTYVIPSVPFGKGGRKNPKFNAILIMPRHAKA
jgi:hypothetical protein